MSVRFVNSSVPYAQGGIGTFDSIQNAINASAPGDSVVLEDNQVYQLQRSLILRDGVDLVCRNGTAVLNFISDSNGPACTDDNIQCSCILSNISLIRANIAGAPTTPYGLHIQNSLSSIVGVNVFAISNIDSGCVNSGRCSGVIAQTTGGTNPAFLHLGPTAKNCSGISTSPLNSVGFSCQSDDTGGYGNVQPHALYCDGRIAAMETDFRCSTEMLPDSILPPMPNIAAATLLQTHTLGFTPVLTEWP